MKPKSNTPNTHTLMYVREHTNSHIPSVCHPCPETLPEEPISLSLFLLMFIPSSLSLLVSVSFVTYSDVRVSGKETGRSQQRTEYYYDQKSVGTHSFSAQTPESRTHRLYSSNVKTDPGPRRCRV